MSNPPDVGHVRLKRAETTSTFGAGILGAGIALLAADLLRSYAVPFVVIGLAMHAWGMFDKHRLESGTAIPRVWWAEALYWGCWAALVALGVYVGLTTV